MGRKAKEGDKARFAEGGKIDGDRTGETGCG